jgi:hypothetical protein
MSNLIPKSRFLGAAGAGTVVLLKSPDKASLPTLPELRRLFDVDKVRHFKANGRYAAYISQLEMALDIFGVSNGTPPWESLATTDYLLFGPGTRQQILFTLKYHSILISGFDLTEAYMTDLMHHLDRYAGIAYYRGNVRHVCESLSPNSLAAQNKNKPNQSITNPDIVSIKQTLTGYGDTALANVTSDIQQWCKTHAWKA